jgi:hypothetical protein
MGEYFYFFLYYNIGYAGDYMIHWLKSVGENIIHLSFLTPDSNHKVFHLRAPVFTHTENI